MILLMVLWVLYSVSEAYEDSQYTVILNHNPTVYPRIITGVTILLLWCGWQNDPLLRCIAFAFLLCASFWFVFELSGNLFRGNYFYYIGTTAKSDHWLKRYELPVFCVRLWFVALAFGLYYYDRLNIY